MLQLSQYCDEFFLIFDCRCPTETRVSEKWGGGLFRTEQKERKKERKTGSTVSYKCVLACSDTIWTRICVKKKASQKPASQARGLFVI